MIDRSILVDMPTEKISFSLPNDKGERYVKYLISSSRKGKKHANNKRITIGIKPANSTKLCPNSNYYKLFQKQVLLDYILKPFVPLVVFIYFIH